MPGSIKQMAECKEGCCPYDKSPDLLAANYSIIVNILFRNMACPGISKNCSEFRKPEQKCAFSQKPQLLGPK